MSIAGPIKRGKRSKRSPKAQPIDVKEWIRSLVNTSPNQEEKKLGTYLTQMGFKKNDSLMKNHLFAKIFGYEDDEDEFDKEPED